MSSSAASSSKGESSKRKAGEPGSSSSARDGKKVKLRPQETAPASAVDEDDEWARFQQEVLSGTAAAEDTAGTAPVAGSGSPAAPPQSTNVYANATIEAQPELRRPANTTATEGDSSADIAGGGTGEETEAQRRRRLAREEHEEIFARLQEEQRLQDEAEERVSSLKSRLERIKAARAAKSASQPNTKSKTKTKTQSKTKTNGSSSGEIEEVKGAK